MNHMKKAQIIIGILLGILFAALAAFYWMTPAGSLPGWMPGFIAGGTEIHIKHGIAALVIALAAFAYAWFGSAKKAN